MIILQELDKGFILQGGKLTSPFSGSSAVYWHTFDHLKYQSVAAESLGISIPNALDKAVSKRLAEFVAGRYCAKQALSELGENSVPGYGRNREPTWPRGSWGSISHSNGVALAMVSKQHSIGLDIECIVDPKLVADISDMILTTRERTLFKQQLTCELFTLIFSLKESFYKAAYPFVKCCFGFSVIDVLNIDWRNGTLTYQVNESLADNIYVGMIGRAFFVTPFPGQILTLVELEGLYN